jgi:hypothetical protein
MVTKDQKQINLLVSADLYKKLVKRALGDGIIFKEILGVQDIIREILEKEGNDLLLQTNWLSNGLSTK